MDTLVDPVEVVSWSQVSAAPRVDAARASFHSLDPEAQVQWFARPHAHPIENEPERTESRLCWTESVEDYGVPTPSGLARSEPSGSVDIDISWELSGDDETDVDPTLVLRKRARR